MYYSPNMGTRKKEWGWPKSTWQCSMERERSRVGQESWSEMHTTPQDKSEWRVNVKALCTIQPQGVQHYHTTAAPLHAAEIDLVCSWLNENEQNFYGTYWIPLLYIASCYRNHHEVGTSSNESPSSANVKENCPSPKLVTWVIPLAGLL